MNKKRIIALFSVCFFLTTIVSCNESSKEEPDHYVPPTPTLVDDKELNNFDDFDRDTYDNSMKLPSACGSVEAADPFVFRFNGYYYMYMTTGGKYIRGYRSEDLLTWEAVNNGLGSGVVYNYGTDGESAPTSNTPFAPEVTYFNGKFYLVTSPSGNGHYILESDSPEGPFTALTSNFGKSIDGSFFLDSNENVYFYTAGNGGINVYQLLDTFDGFELNDDGSEFSKTLINCQLGGWNEGPYMLQRDGSYYLTYCGTHYLSKDYRVDYAYCDAGSDVTKINSYKRMDNLICETLDNYNGLGHSCTVLGPDMDSYYLVYHELEKSSQRYYCLSRLSFDGPKMIVNNVAKDFNLTPALPPFTSRDGEGFVNEGDFLLSPSRSEDEFTVEFNTIGGGKYVFSYIDKDNYSYIELKNDVITVYKVTKGTAKQVHKVILEKEYDYSVYHTIRLSYAKGLMDIHFDNMEKANNINSYFKGGKIGLFKNNTFEEIGYCAYSNVGQGSSDKKEFNSGRILANSYDDRLSYLREGSSLNKVEASSQFRVKDSNNLTIKNKDDRATYRINTTYTEDYAVNLRVPATSLNKKIGIRLDNETMKEVEITSETPRLSKDDVYLNVGSIEGDGNVHYLSIYNVGDEFTFSEIGLDIIPDNEAKSFTNSISDADFVTRGDVTKVSSGIQTDDSMLNVILTKNSYMNAEASATVKLNNLIASSYVGLAFNIGAGAQKYNGDSDYSGGNNENNYKGYLFAVNGDGDVRMTIYDYKNSFDYYSSSTSINKNGTITLNVAQDNNTYTFSINGSEVFTVHSNVGRLSGRAGVVTYKTDSIINSFSVE